MCVAGLIKREGDYLELTEQGRAFSMARATRPLKRTTADQLLAGAVEAARQVNADGSLPHYVEEVYVFGSYLGDNLELGDLDLAIKLCRRQGSMTSREWVEWCLDAGIAAGKRTWLQQFGYSEKIVHRRVKQRSSYVSVHDTDELDELKAERKLVFQSEQVAPPKRQ